MPGTVPLVDVCLAPYHTGRWRLIVAWSFAAIMCAMVVWTDALFVILRNGPPADSSDTLESVPMSPVSVRGARLEDFGLLWVGQRDPYALLARLGAAVAGLACAAPMVGLFGLVSHRSSAAFRHALLLLAALVPLVALEYLGFRARALYAEACTAWDLAGTVSARAMPVTWWARVAWLSLAVAAAVSWWREHRRRKGAPADASAFE